MQRFCIDPRLYTPHDQQKILSQPLLRCGDFNRHPDSPGRSSLVDVFIPSIPNSRDALAHITGPLLLKIGKD